MCRTAVDVVQVARCERRAARRAALIRVIGDEWYWWLGEIVGVALTLLVLAGTLPLWTLAIAGFLLLRSVSRALLLLVRGGLDELPN